ncbi:hypothetical protein CI105_02330 [Candidatus Izimaplasma bacterium ZiA1]|uniref:hypothetical protein n=1 Tax=Candidatus Izimoplasma sp. ZiA1 TaxID=2024899 RepID=UPI000BAA4B7B|nr:hypothetical protein CI105_02330 [Candidatus Izimaplasma bacterium ZiA1]
MKQTVFIISLLALILTSFFGVFGSQIISELKTEVSSIETYDDTSINTSIDSLISEINSLETSDYSELALQIETLQTAISEISEFDDTDLVGKTTSLEAQIELLNGLITTLQNKITALENTPGVTPEVLFDENGSFLEFYEVMSKLCVKYFNTTQMDCSVNDNGSSMSVNSWKNINNYTNEELIARMVMFYNELSNYSQYLDYFQVIVIETGYLDGDYSINIASTLSSLYILSGNVTYEDILPSIKWPLNRALSYKFDGDLLIENQITLDTSLIETYIEGFITNNTFGDDLLQPLN